MEPKGGSGENRIAWVRIRVNDIDKTQRNKPKENKWRKPYRRTEKGQQGKKNPYQDKNTDIKRKNNN